MAESKKVPVAYVTKWATTRGILVVRGAETYKAYLTKKSPGVHLFVAASHWTEDKGIAEARYLSALKKREKALTQQLKATRQAWSDGPRFTEDES